MDTMTQLFRDADDRYACVLAESERARFRAGLVMSLIKGLLIASAVWQTIDLLA
jgi:hypothetical protein